MIDRATAKRRLVARWHEQVERFPRMRESTPLALYIDVNLERVRVFGLLASYDRDSDNARSQ